MATEVETPEKVYCCTNSNDSLANAMLASNGYGNQMWNNPMMYLVWMWMMRWMNGNGWDGFGGGAENYNSRAISQLQSTVDNNHNNDLTIQAIQGNGAAIHELASNLNCDFNTMSQAICSVKSAIESVAGQIGYSSERVINAVNLGNQNITSKICECCCNTQQSILKMGYENQLATERQTNALGSKMDANHSADLLQDCQYHGQTMSRIDQLANGITAGFANIGYEMSQNSNAILQGQKDQTQTILNALNNHWTQDLRDKMFEMSQTAQTASIVSQLKTTA